MKYLSVLVFAILLSSTWYIINSEASISLETHIGIQSKLGQLIIDTVKAKKPTATEIQVEQVWTEPHGSGKPVRVKAHFAYRFSEPSADGGKVDSLIEGEGLLEKQNSEVASDGLDHWVLTNVKTNNDIVTFEKAQIITTGSGNAAGSQNETPSNEH